MFQQPNGSFSFTNTNSSKSPSKKTPIYLTSYSEIDSKICVKSIGELLGPEKIYAASETGNKSLCIYFNRPETAKNLVSMVPFVRINGEIYNISGDERRILLLSNVYSSISDDVIETELESLGLNLHSEIKHILLGLTEPRYQHILSFQRAVEISPVEEIPESIIIKEGNDSYRIFLSWYDKDLSNSVIYEPRFNIDEISANQAIFLDDIEGCPLQNYVESVGELVGPSNIISASRIRNKSICMYLRSDFSSTFIRVQRETVEVRKFERQFLLVTDIPPSITDESIKRELEKNGIILLSSMNNLSFGFTEPEFKHILNLQRIMEIAPTENIPESLLINEGGHSSRVFLKITDYCKRCKLTNHGDLDCKFRRVDEPFTTEPAEFFSKGGNMKIT